MKKKHLNVKQFLQNIVKCFVEFTVQDKITQQKMQKYNNQTVYFSTVNHTFY